MKPAIHEIVSDIGRRRVSAILRTDDQGKARKAMAAAVAGGFRLIEFTLTTPGAMQLVNEFSKNRDLLVGAGTVLDPGTAKEAVAAGARFLVSPVVDPEVIRAAQDLGVPSIPGASTPTEMLAAHRAGAPILKVFPAPADVASFVTQVRGPFPDWKLYPTAGITLENFPAVLKAGAFGVGFVASLFTPADLAAGDFDAILKRSEGIMTRLRELA